MKCATWTLTIILSALVLAGCSNSTDPADEGPEYLDYSTPDNVIDNFVTSWNEMDIAEYRDVLLYTGDPLGREEGVYAEFKFYFIEDTGEGPYWGLDAERTHTGALFGGNSSPDGTTPGVESVDLRFNAAGDWSAPDNPFEVQGDEYPDGTLYRTYQTDASFYLRGAIEGSQVNVLLVRDTVRFYVIPIGEGEYRLWKWLDIDPGLLAAEETSWSNVKHIW